MDVEYIRREQEKLAEAANKKISDALEDMREEISAANAQAANQIKMRDSQLKQEKVQEDVQKKVQEELEKVQKPSNKPLVYLAYPMESYGEVPVWVEPLKNILEANGYLVYNPHESVDSQFSPEDLPLLDALSIKLVKKLCPLYFIPEEVLLSFEVVWKILHKGDMQDNYGIVFQRLWFLIRSSLVIGDLTRVLGSGTAQELLYARQLDIPVIGFLAPTGHIDPYIHRSVTAFFSGRELGSLLPMIKGYAPV